MKRFLKLVSGIVIAAVMATGLSGCGGKGAVSGGDVTSVSIWMVAGHAKSFMEKRIEEFNKGEGKDSGIKIEATFIGSESYKKSVELALQNGSAPDFFSSSDVQKNIELGNLASVNDLPNADKLLEKYGKYLKDHVTTWDGKTYRVPRAATTMGLIYNVDMFKAAGIVDENGNACPPKTLAEMREVAKKLTDASKKQYGIIYPRKWSSWADSDIVYSAAPSVGRLDYDYKTGKFDMSHTKPLIQNIIDITNDGSAFPGATNIDNDAARAYFAEGNIGMKIAYSFDVGVLKDQFPAKIDWEVAPLPVADENETYMQRLYYDYSYLMNAESLNRVGGEKMEKVFDFMNGDEYITAAYLAGISIPYDYNIVKDVKVDDSQKQWKSFCEIVDISVDYPSWPQSTMTGVDNFQTKVNKMLDGEITIEDGIAQYNTDRNNGVDLYYEVQTDAWKKPNEYIISDWNAKR